MRKLIDQWIAGPALSLYRYQKSQHEIAKTENLPFKLTEHHLSDCAAYPDRKKLIERFGNSGVVAEIGVARGDFSDIILASCNPEKLILIDYWKEGKRGHGVTSLIRSHEESDYDQVKKRFSDEIQNKQVELIRDWSWKGLEQLDDESLDWVYIDAGHDFDSVCKDLGVALRKVKPNGIIAGHDYVRWGRFGYRCGVIEAVTKFCVEQNFKIIGLTFEHKYPPSYALQRI